MNDNWEFGDLFIDKPTLNLCMYMGNSETFKNKLNLSHGWDDINKERSWYMHITGISVSKLQFMIFKRDIVLERVNANLYEIGCSIRYKILNEINRD